MNRHGKVTLASTVLVDLPIAEIDCIFVRREGQPLWDTSVARVELASPFVV